MNKNIILTLTTIPGRLHSAYNYDMRYCIESLLNQNGDYNYEVHLNIPNVYDKTGEEYIIPEWLDLITDPKLKIFRTDDYGSITKLIPTLKRIDDKDTYIIVVDDDIIYHTDLITEHIKNREKWPDYVVGYDGMRSRNTDGTFANTFKDGRDYYFTATGTNSLVDILQHYKSVSYIREFFEEDFYEFINTYGIWCDDKTISAYMAMKKRGRLATFYEHDKIYDTHEEYLANVRHTFPITKHTDHDHLEGCNLERGKQFNEIEDARHNKLFTEFIDFGYKDNTWKV